MAKMTAEQILKSLDDIHERLTELAKLDIVNAGETTHVEEKLRDIGDQVIAMLGEGTNDDATRPG